MTAALIDELGGAKIEVNPHGRPMVGVLEGLFSNCPA
jgi:hypothetical protein